MEEETPDRYTRLETGDGSPTLRLIADGEAMHAVEGAFTETQYIYQPPVELAFAAEKHPALISVGLGLGYNEILMACESIKHGKMPALIHSYESVPELIRCFRQWILGNESQLNGIYEEILNLYQLKYALPASAIRFRLEDLLKDGKLVLDGAIEADTVPPKANAICFDAFSSKTTPHLWSEEFLTGFFKNAGGENCFVATYACTGALKRALKKNGFTVELKKGFGVKRQSTTARKTTSL